MEKARSIEFTDALCSRLNSFDELENINENRRQGKRIWALCQIRRISVVCKTNRYTTAELYDCLCIYWELVHDLNLSPSGRTVLSSRYRLQRRFIYDYLLLCIYLFMDDVGQ